jgi:hypothetical protein
LTESWQNSPPGEFDGNLNGSARPCTIAGLARIQGGIRVQNLEENAPERWTKAKIEGGVPDSISSTPPEDAKFLYGPPPGACKGRFFQRRRAKISYPTWLSPGMWADNSQAAIAAAT